MSDTSPKKGHTKWGRGDGAVLIYLGFLIFFFFFSVGTTFEVVFRVLIIEMP